MRVLVQRVKDSWVEFDGQSTPKSGPGLLCLVGFAPEDSPAVLEPMASKLLYLRVFEDQAGKMNISLGEHGGTLVLVPQFTLYADCRKGRRPSFNTAMEPVEARRLFEAFQQICRENTHSVISGSFGADMKVHLVNDGPVTIMLDSRELNL
ncbi:MAG: D-aminoacyl-tRNA deacylase [Deltaproteobacteria bacterium]|nr:D-aminoacyl-tRNA deacylase [Deltaproteobacteria bacterium]